MNEEKQPNFPDKYHLSRKESVYLLKKNIVELVYNAGKFEGLNTTLLQTEEIIKYNEQFVANKGYEKYLTSKYPDKKLAILSCMDTRLTELLPAALGLKNGDAKLIKNAGGLVISPFDSAMRSLLVAIYELGVEEIMVVAHRDQRIQPVVTARELEDHQHGSIGAGGIRRPCG